MKRKTKKYVTSKTGKSCPRASNNGIRTNRIKPIWADGLVTCNSPNKTGNVNVAKQMKVFGFPKATNTYTAPLSATILRAGLQSGAACYRGKPCPIQIIFMKMHINYFKKDNLVSVHEWCHWQSLELFNITLTKEKKKNCLGSCNLPHPKCPLRSLLFTR